MRKNTIPIDPALYKGAVISYAMTFLLALILAVYRRFWALIPLAALLLAYYAWRSGRAMTRIRFEADGIVFYAPLRKPVKRAYTDYVWQGTVRDQAGGAFPALSDTPLTLEAQRDRASLQTDDHIVVLTWNEETRAHVKANAPEAIFRMLEKYAETEPER